MKLKQMMGLSSALCLSAASLQAQEAVNVEQLQKQLRQMQEQFEKQQQQHRQQMEALQNQLSTIQQNQSKAAEDQSRLKEEMNRSIFDVKQVASAASGVSDAPPAPERKPWRPTDPIRLRSGSAYLDLGLIGTFAAGSSTASDIEGGTQLGGHDPNQRGFTVQGVEANFAGAVDPYFKANATILFQIDSGGESFLELEEAYADTLALPGNFQIRGGQFLTEFGRHNQLHTHSFGFVDVPLINGRFLGPDGLRNPGGRVSWLMPTPFYSELFFAIQNSQGETAHSFRSDHEDEIFLGRLHEVDRVKSFGDLLFTPRYALSFDLTDTQTILLGTSAAFGPNASGADACTQLYGADFYWKWKPTNHVGGFPFVSWQTEAMLRRFKADAFDWDLNGDGILDMDELDLDSDGIPDVLPRETLTDYGFYSQIQYGFCKGWVAGLRGDYVTGDRADYESMFGRDLDRATRWRISPNLTWYPSEFSKIRLQYNYDDRAGIGVDHSVWLQFEFVLGAHAAHKF